MTRRTQGGFTIIEVLIAIIVLVVGMLGLVMTAAMLSRMMGRSNRAQAAATFASQRMEKMRPAACIAAQRVAGSDTLRRGSVVIAVNRYEFIDMGSSSYRLRVISTWPATMNRTRTDTLEMGVPCQT
jgi:prepilin-type N-terminal cleavage/methylation domain-containing protein